MENLNFTITKDNYSENKNNFGLTTQTKILIISGASLIFIAIFIVLLIKVIIPKIKEKLKKEKPKHKHKQKQIQIQGKKIILEKNNQDDIKSTSTKSTMINPKISLCMIGDTLIHKKLIEAFHKTENDTYDFNLIFANMQDTFKQYDFRIVNEEVLIAGKDFGFSGAPRFNSPFELSDAIDNANLNVISKATNHGMDRGKEGILTDLNNWKTNHKNLIITGMYSNSEDSQKITFLKKNGYKIAILNYSYGTNKIPLPEDMPYAINLLKQEKIKKDIEKARNEQANFIIVIPHWGTEYIDVKSKRQIFWTNFFYNNGVDLVIGAHPHVIQPVEWITKENNNHKMLVYYSLGNFVNRSPKAKEKKFRCFLGGMAHIVLERDEDNTNKLKISEAKFIPLITHVYNDNKATTYKLKDYNENLCKQNKIKVIFDKKFTYNKAVKHFKKVISSKFLDF